MQEQSRSSYREQLNNETFALFSTRFYRPKIAHLIKRIGMAYLCVDCTSILHLIARGVAAALLHQVEFVEHAQAQVRCLRLLLCAVFLFQHCKNQ